MQLPRQEREVVPTEEEPPPRRDWKLSRVGSDRVRDYALEGMREFQRKSQIEALILTETLKIVKRQSTPS